METPTGVLLAVLALLVAIAFATGGGHDPAPARQPPVSPIAVIAKRVEAVRRQRFAHLPQAVRVTPAQAREEGLADLRRGYPDAARAADEALYATLGLVPAGTDLEKVASSVFGEQVAGYYDPRTGRLRIVDGPVANRVLDEITLAHELDHALEDQVFGFDQTLSEDTGDRGYAYHALLEGSATAVMFEYATRYFKPDEALGGVLSSAFAVTSTTPLPPFIEAGLTWPYIAGREFINDLYRSAGDSWRLVDVALKARPPSSTEQVMHPEKWLRVEEPDRVELRGVGAALGPGWSRAAAGTFGEWQTGELLSLGGSAKPEAAAGWGGDRYELWRDGKASVVAMRWRWETRRDAGEFLAALHAAMSEGVAASSRIGFRGDEVMLAVAPDGPTALRVLGALMA